MNNNQNIPLQISFPNFLANNGELCVYEGESSVPFAIKRVFTVAAPLNSDRGQHAHKECIQLLVCLSGKVLVTCDDGIKKTEHYLEDMNSGLLIPAGIWAEQKYLTENTLMMVFCSLPYAESDYLRDYQAFKLFKISRD